MNVSRETFDRLSIYRALVEKWTARINLISKASVDDIWQRHFVDSAQLLKLVPKEIDHWADLGSGAGFPGLVIAILAVENGFPKHVTLVESDVRKAVFLRTVIRETGIEAKVKDQRIEDLDPLKADILSARALAPMVTLMEYTARHLGTEGVALFPKGKNWRDELQKAQSKWCFSYNVDRSETSESSVILRVKGVGIV